MFGRGEKKQLREAVFHLRDCLAFVDPAAADGCRAFGCCGCGAWMADVRVGREPYYESYCWRCVRRHGVTDYAVLSDVWEVV